MLADIGAHWDNQEAASTNESVVWRVLTEHADISCKLTEGEVGKFRGYLENQTFSIIIEGCEYSGRWEIVWKRPYFHDWLHPYLMPKDRGQAKAILGRFKSQGINVSILLQLLLRHRFASMVEVSMRRRDVVGSAQAFAPERKVSAEIRRQRQQVS